MTHRVQPGQQLGNYRLLRQLGAGGFAEVFYGEHRYLHRKVAIKVLTIPLTQKDADRFLHEAQTMVALQHPSIVACTDFGVEHGIPFLVMDYAPHGTLRNQHPRGTIVPFAEVITYTRQVAAALQYAHDQGVIHLDVKPENMLLSAKGTVLLSDFGLAQFTYSVSTMTSSIRGTLGYIAPETFQLAPQAASDQFALAVVVYEWLTGSLPYGRVDGRAVALSQFDSAPPSLHTADPTLPLAVDKVVRIALAKDPQERYPSVIAFAEALAQAYTRSSAGDDLDELPEAPETLYKEGLRARGLGQLELAEQLLTALRAQAPSFRQEIVAEQLRQIRTARRPQLIAEYQAQAEAANQMGAWDREIAAWRHLLQLTPAYGEASTARTRIRLAEQHKRYDQLYWDAEHMVAEGNMAGAKSLLEQLWEKDSYYGDPAGLSKRLKIRAPLTYQQEQHQFKEQEKAEEQREEQRAFRERAYGPTFHHQWIVCGVWFFLLSGLGITIGALTQSWLLALITLGITSSGGWWLGYRKALDGIPFVVLSTVSLFASLGLTLALARLNYRFPMPSPYTETVSTGLFSSKDVTTYHEFFLGRQLQFGLLCGTITALGGVIIALLLRPPWGKRIRSLPSLSFSVRKKPASSYLTLSELSWIVVGIFGGGASVTGVIAAVAPVNDWGFGWDKGAYLMVLGFFLGTLLGTSVGASLPLWWTVVRLRAHSGRRR